MFKAVTLAYLHVVPRAVHIDAGHTYTHTHIERAASDCFKAEAAAASVAAAAVAAAAAKRQSNGKTPIITLSSPAHKNLFR